MIAFILQLHAAVIMKKNLPISILQRFSGGKEECQVLSDDLADIPFIHEIHHMMQPDLLALGEECKIKCLDSKFVDHRAKDFFTIMLQNTEAAYRFALK